MGYTLKSIGIGALGGILIAIAIISSTSVYFTYGSGKLVVLITDPPDWGDATHVYIRFSKIEIHRASEGDESGWITVVEDPGWINLTDVLNTSKVLAEANLQTGKYNMIRFEILEAKVTVNKEDRKAEVPSGKLRIVITHGELTVNVGETSKVLIDFETRVTYSHGKGHKLIPTVKAVPLGNSD